MIDFNAAADTARRMARDREAMAFIADAFSQLGSLELATREATQARDKAVADREEALAGLATVQREAAEVEAKAKQVEQLASENAAAMINEAVERIAQAEAEHHAAAEKARAEHSRIHGERVAAMESELSAVRRRVDEAKADESELAGKVAERAAELAEIETRLRKIREAAAALAV